MTEKYNKKVKKNLVLVSFLQAAGIAAYCSLVSWFMFNIQTLLRNRPDNVFDPLLFLSLFVVSAGVCSLLFGGYAFTLIWEEKKTKQAIKLCVYTLGWLIVFVAGILVTQLI